MEHRTVLMARNRTALEQELALEQKELLQKYIDCLGTGEASCEGFSLANKLRTEALSDT